MTREIIDKILKIPDYKMKSVVQWASFFLEIFVIKINILYNTNKESW